MKPKYRVQIESANNGFIVDVQNTIAPIGMSGALDGYMEKLGDLMEKHGGGDEIQDIIDKASGKDKDLKAPEIDTKVGTHIFTSLEETIAFVSYVYNESNQ